MNSHRKIYFTLSYFTYQVSIFSTYRKYEGATKYNAPAPKYNAPALEHNAPAPKYNAPAPEHNAPALKNNCLH